MSLFSVENLTTKTLLAAFFFMVAALQPIDRTSAETRFGVGAVTPVMTCSTLFDVGSDLQVTDISNPSALEAIQSDARPLRYTEIGMYGQRLFVANLEIFARQYGFESHHELHGLRVSKSKHEKVSPPYSHYRSEIVFEQNGKDYEIAIFFRSNGDTAFLDIEAPQDLRLRAVGEKNGMYLTIDQAELPEEIRKDQIGE